MRQVGALIRRFAENDFPVVIQGDTGTGKEVVASEIHRISQRSDGPMVVIDCTTIPESLFESELFGYEIGAFTGGGKRRAGLCEAAEGGTLVLDEIADMPPQLQAKLLRFIECGTIRRVGGRKDFLLDVRCIALAQKPLAALAAQGLFRNDLWQRLNVFSIQIPPLRERHADILPLFEYFLKQDPLRAKPLNERAKRLLLTYDWPGNARELRNATTRALWTSTTDEFMPEDFGLPSATAYLFSAAEARGGPWQPLADIERDAREHVVTYILDALDACGNNIAETARHLCVSREALSSRLGRIDPSRRRA